MSISGGQFNQNERARALILAEKQPILPELALLITSNISDTL